MIEKQARFARSVALLIQHAEKLGYQVTFGEAYRTSEQAAIYAKRGTGVLNSLHTERLAIDLNLYRDGVWLMRSEDHTALGQWWESLGPEYKWGGRFPKPDGNHYSLSPDGKRA